MRKLVLSALLLSAFPLVSMGAHDDGGEVGGESQWTYYIENGGAIITASTATGAVTIPSVLGGYAVKKVGSGSIFGNYKTSVTSVVFPEGVTHIGNSTFQQCSNLTNVTIPFSVVSIASNAFQDCSNLTSVSIPFYTTVVELPGNTGSTYPQIIPDYTILVGRDDFVNTLVSKLANTLANNDAFVTAVANKIKSTSGNYGIATQTGLSSAITTATEPLATKAQITTAINEGKAAGIASVTSSPSTWSMFTSSEIQNMSIDDLVLTRDANGLFVLNYDIQQSEDLQNWTTYQEYALPLTNLPINKAFVRIKALEGTQEALLDAKINNTVSYLWWYKSASISYYGRYNRFPKDGERIPIQPYTRTYGDGAIVNTADNTTFGDILISEGVLDRLMLPIGEYGYSNPVGYTSSAVILVSSGVAAKPVNAGGINYPLILCRNYNSYNSNTETRLFTASANSSRVVFILIPGLSTTEVAALKTKIDGPFNNTILGASDLVAKAVAGTATGTPAEYVNRGNCLITTSPLAGGGYDAWVYVAHD